MGVIGVTRRGGYESGGGVIGRPGGTVHRVMHRYCG